MRGDQSFIDAVTNLDVGAQNLQRGKPILAFVSLGENVIAAPPLGSRRLAS
jgi:hypothetical protein